jgi:hypothetical protein
MRSLLQISSAPLLWKQPKLMEAAFELKYSEEVLATLKFKNSLGSLATGTVAEGVWTFKRQGFLKTYVTIRQHGVESNIAVFHNNTWSEGGTLELPDGRKYPANSNFWNSKFEFTDEPGEPYLRYTNIGGFKLHSQMDILPAARNNQDTPWMVLLGWYLAVMNSRDGEMVAALF